MLRDELGRCGELGTPAHYCADHIGSVVDEIKALEGVGGRGGQECRKEGGRRENKKAVKRERERKRRGRRKGRVEDEEEGKGRKVGLVNLHTGNFYSTTHMWY